LYQSCF